MTLNPKLNEMAERELEAEKAVRVVTKQQHRVAPEDKECTICFVEFAESQSADRQRRASVERHIFWPCQHASACGDCALRM